MKDHDIQCLKEAIKESELSVKNGNHPFGAVLADKKGVIILHTQNSVETTRDATGHAETNLMRQASLLYDKEFLETCTIYSSAEPCVMCSGAIYWTGVRRVVYGLSETSLFKLTGDDPANETLQLPCREVFKQSRRETEVIGPLLEDEAGEVHKGFWKP
ncbi:MAG: nucleoside deaminase [Spirochaetia bacterium]|nr:nucleoside deaminase [Spirochaetia bacterium]